MILSIYTLNTLQYFFSYKSDLLYPLCKKLTVNTIV